MPDRDMTPSTGRQDVARVVEQVMHYATGDRDEVRDAKSSGTAGRDIANCWMNSKRL